MHKRGTKQSCFLLVVFLLALFSISLPVMAAKADQTSKESVVTKKGLVKEKGKYFYYKNGKKVRNRWVNVKVGSKKYKYYFRDNGAACTSVMQIGDTRYCFSDKGRLLRYTTNRLVTRGKHEYCPDKNGKCQTGWLIVSGKLYYANSKGRIQKDKTLKGVTLDKNGKAVDSIATSLKKETMAVVSQITTPGMTKPQKLQACWNYMVSNRFRYYNVTPDLNRKGWQKEFAYRMLITKSGSCSSFACAFAALAAEVGYDPVVIYGRVPGSRDRAADGFTRHCWVRINGLYYDPEAHFAGWMRGVYARSGYPISHQITRVINFTEG